MTLDKLKTNTRKELASLAKRHHVAGWHGMRKEELIEALIDVQRAKAPDRSRGADRSRATGGVAVTEPAAARNPDPPRTKADAPRSVRSVARVKPQPPEASNRKGGATAAAVTPTPKVAVESTAKPASVRPSAVSPAAASPSAASPVGSQNGRAAVRNGSGNLRVSSSPSRIVRKDISTADPVDGSPEELTAVAHDPYWIHARWVLRRSTVQRAEAALGSDWFRAVPVIRVHALDVDDVKGVQANWVRDVEIHGECDHWFVPVENAPGTFKLQIGYLATGGRFFALAKSRRVSTPRPGSKAAERIGWNRGPSSVPSLHRPTLTRSGGGDPEFEKFLAARATSYAVAGTDHRVRPQTDVPFALQTELVVSGTADPNSQLSVQGETVKVGRDGHFTLRVALGDGRTMVPAVAISPDGHEQRTIVLSIDRNIKVLEPQAIND